MDSKESDIHTGVLDWKGPHCVIVPRTESGFGFTLRHFVVYPPQSVLDDSKSDEEPEQDIPVKETKLDGQDFRLEPQDTIFVKSVKPGSAAHLAGLNTGDRIVAVNGDSVTGKTYSQVIALIQASTKTLKLLVVPKDEDILQMAYQSEVGESTYASNSSLQDTDVFHPHSPLSYDYPVRHPQHHHHHQSSLSSGQDYSPLYDQRLIHPSDHPSTSGSSTTNRNLPHHNQHTNSNKVFQDSPSKMSIASNIPSKTKYSFGLYFPPKTTTAQSSTINNDIKSSSSSISGSRTISTESLGYRGGEDSAMSKPVDTAGQRRWEPKLRKSSLDETSQKTSLAKSRDYFIRHSADKSNSDAKNRYALRHSTHERSSSDKPTYIITRSQTVSAISPTHSAGSSSSHSRRSGDFSRSRRRGSEELEYKTEVSRQINPISSESKSVSNSRNVAGKQKMSSYSRETNLANAPVSKSSTTTVTATNSGGTKTFVVRIPCDQQQPTVTISQGRETTNQVPVRQSYGTAFALKRSPIATHIEIQKAIGKPIVSQRKYQFESKREEIPVPTKNVNQNNRYKMEIDRIRTQPKFSSIASRKASFEQSPDRDMIEHLTKEMESSGNEQPSESPLNQSPKPLVKIRKISTERYSSATPPPQPPPGFRERSATTPTASSTGGGYLESPPIRIYVSPGMNAKNSHSTSPVVEIVPIPAYGGPDSAAGVKNSKGESTRNNLSSPFQEDSVYQRRHASPSPSSLSTGTMGDSGVWVKSYHGSSDMLDSSSSGVIVTSSGVSTSVMESHADSTSIRVYPRLRHKSYLEAVNSPRGTDETGPSPPVIPHVPSISTSSLPAFPSTSIYTAPSQSTTGVHAYSQAQPQTVVVPQPSPASIGIVQPSDTSMYQQQQQHLHYHYHHPQQFHGSSSSHSLSSIDMTDMTQPGCLALTVMSASDSAVAVSGAGKSTSVTMVTSKPSKSLSVTMRKKPQETIEDQASKLHRRTSYLMATAKDRTNTVPIEKAFSPPQPQQSPQLASNVRRESSVKLGKFFGEQIPSIAEGVESKSVDDEEPTPPPTPPPEVIRKGPLICKIAVMEGKKCSDRTWKPVYVILRQTEMFLKRDSGSSTSGGYDNHLIPLKSCMVEFARDYAKKKKNVFRLTTHQECEYLFQAEDRGTMLCWIQAIKSINEPEKAEKMDEMIAHEQAKHNPVPVEIQVIPSSKLSPPLGHMAKKLSGLSLRSKLTASPNMRRKKSNASEKAEKEEKKEKEEGVKKSWKGRIPMMKNLKKHSEDSLAPPSLDIDPALDCCRQFGMPIEDCFPSPHNEYVPLIVELCTRIVEARGLEVVGVYRVPGNSAAVNALTEEFNRGIDNVNIDNEKLLDINVISSLLKSFFRKLPEPLVNAESYDGFIEANRNPDADKRMLKLKRLLHLLPPHHNETFKHMAEHLNKVASYGNINKMDAKNLAIMFGPTLIRKSDDDTVSLVTDMSDQCRIIESIILHHEWFFSQWDQDSHIPMETKVETVLLNEVHGEKDDDEEADSAISTKEIISSIVGAASRKLRGQQQKSEDSLDSACGMLSSQDVTSISFYQDSKTDERSLLPSISSSKSRASLASSHSEDIMIGRSLNGSTQGLMHPTHVTNSEPDFLDLEFADACSPTTASFTRHLSDDSLLEKNDELEISHGLGTSMSRQTIHNTLKRIGNDVKTLLQTFEQKQMIEMERRRKEQEMIEHEHLRTQLELEQEDSHSVDDWLAMRGTSGISSQMPDLVSSSFIMDTYSPSHGRYGSVISDSDRLERMDRELKLSSSPYSQSPMFHSHQGSLDSAISKTSGNSSLDDILSSSGSYPLQQSCPPPMVPPRSNLPAKRGSSVSKQKNIHLAVEKQHLRPSSFRLSMGRRHGSLDSLIDLIDKRSSWASSDSEDGSDLLTSLTTTFDQKLQILVNPKYKLTGNGSRKHYASDLVKPAMIVSDMKEAAMWRSGDAHRGKPPSLHSFPPPSSGLESERPFRDPSLHRSAKSETKIGIASRFERNDNRTLSSSPVLNLSDSSSPGQRSPRKAPLPDYGAFLNRHNGQSYREGAAISLTQPKKLEDNGVYVLRSLNKSRKSDFPRPISKSEKTEMNSNLARLSKEEKSLTVNMEEGGDKQENKENKRKRRSERKQGHRRHTVGGTQDFEHIDALVQVCCSGEEDSSESVKVSAWDQLQPAVKDRGDRNLHSWLQKERIRGSTPDLSIDE